MKKNGLLTFIGVAVCIFLLVLVLLTQALGVPFWYIFHLKKLQIIDNPYLVVEVSPASPLNIGEKVTVTVTNSSTNLPVENATVHITKDSINFEKYTDSNGKASFEFLGEVMVVYAEGTDINRSDYSAIPKAPDLWVRNYQISLVSAFASAIVGGLVGAFATTLLQRKTKKGKGKKNIR